MSLKKAKIITIASVKGGTGKTTTTLNLAGALSLQKKKVLILDLDLYSGSIVFSLNISNDQDIYRLSEDIGANRFGAIEEYCIKYNDYIDVIPSPKDPRNANKISSKYIPVVLTKVMYQYDVILIDTTHILSDFTLIALDFSDMIFYVINNDPIDLKNMATRISIHKDMEQENYKIILNESRDKQRNKFTKNDIQAIIKNPIDYTIPKSFYLKNIDQYILDGKILTLQKGLMKNHKKAFDTFEKIASLIMKK